MKAKKIIIQCYMFISSFRYNCKLKTKINDTIHTLYLRNTQEILQYYSYRTNKGRTNIKQTKVRNRKKKQGSCDLQVLL
jgi:hypothetical protein